MRRQFVSAAFAVVAWGGSAQAQTPTGLANPDDDATPAATPAPAVTKTEPAPPPPEPEDKLPPVEIGIFGGAFIDNNRHQFYDLPTSVVKYGSETGRPNLDRLAPQLGLRLSVFMTDNIGLQADFSWTHSGDAMADTVTILHFGGSLIAQAPMRDNAGKQKFTPYAELGWGVWDSMSDQLGGAVHFPVHAGAGARFYVTDQISLGANFRYYRGPGDTDPYTLGAGYAEFGVSVGWIPHFKPSKPEPVKVYGDSDGDGYQDQDGCPDPDNDGDGIPDVNDKCPSEPEDKDGYKDLDGCPDPDNDGDGIPDSSDKCPNEPETINGVQDEDGCPDRGDALVVLSPERLELLEPIQFEKGDKLSKKSTNLLGQIGATLRAHSEIARLRVTVYTQPTKNSDKDQELSDKRASAIRDWLIKWGIEDKRLVSRGFGGTKPLVPADQKGAAAMNERVELIILERK